MGRKKRRIFLANLAGQKSQVVKEEVASVNDQITDSVTIPVEPEPVAVVEEAVEEVAPALTPDPEVVKPPMKVLKTPKVK
jgi:hypothetical protein